MNQFQNPLALIGRIMMSVLFIPAGYGKLTHFEGTVGYIASHGLPLASIAAVLTIIVEIGGGLAVLTGFLTRYAALVLAVFSVLAGVFFHNFWALPPEQVANMQIHFWKNIAIAGGFLILAAFGPGAISIDAKRGAA
jgi:putative oxidoreductase